MNSALEAVLRGKFNHLLENDCEFRFAEGWFVLVYTFLRGASLILDDHSLETGEMPFRKYSCFKEKFGSLCIHESIRDLSKYTPEKGFPPTLPKLLELERLVKWKSSVVCELCSAPGTLRLECRWIRTLCDFCYKEYATPGMVGSTDPERVKILSDTLKGPNKPTL